MREAYAMARFCDSNQKRGLTLVELIVVLVILAVLAALLVPSLTGYIDKAVEKRVMLQASSLMTAAQATIDEAYAKGQLVYSAAADAYVPSSAAVKQAMIKQILDLSEMSEDDCGWRFSITVASNTDYPTAKIDILEFCNKAHSITYRLRNINKRYPGGWSGVTRQTTLSSKWPRPYTPICLSSAEYDPTRYPS